MAKRSLARTRTELADFLRRRREQVTPEEVGLPAGRRRRTPGLRREEVAALAGVGLTWYTWLEQGRDISVSATFLDNLARTLKLDAPERRHLFLLAHQRLPSEPGKTWCVVPPLIHRLMNDLSNRPAYVLNLRWDVLAWNESAERVFEFSRPAPQQRNLLWLLFTEPFFRTLFDPWEAQAAQMLSSFRRDFARASQEATMEALVDELSRAAPDFNAEWQKHAVHAPCEGVRYLALEGLGAATFEHTSLIVDEDRHLRLVYYALRDEQDNSAFHAWLREGSSESA